ncbi:MAG: ASCH domain-containing protein [Solirubrobacteraceae bacterium]
MEQNRICEFGFPGPLRDRLVAAVLSGAKTATTSLLAEWEAEGDELPEAGEQETVIDSAGEPVATIEITGCEVRKLSEVDDAVAHAEGEDYSTASGWRAEHERFWREEVLPEWGDGERPTISDETAVVVQWFQVKERL